MKTINLYFDFEFTSLSPDAQPISLGIISDETGFTFPNPEPKTVTMKDRIPIYKSFYAEFSDFDLNRCDDWVKENVVSKLILNKPELPEGKHAATIIDKRGASDTFIMYQREWEEGDHPTLVRFDNNPMFYGALKEIRFELLSWLSQFSDYQIQFICDCGTWDWYWMVQLLADWETKKELVFTEVEHYSKPEHIRHEEELKLFNKSKGREIVRVVDKLPKLNVEIRPEKVTASCQNNSAYYILSKTGLPKLPENISPVPQDLNDLIAVKQNWSVKEAFDFDRSLAFIALSDSLVKEKDYKKNEHNALFDAKVIKEIYNKLKSPIN